MAAASRRFPTLSREEINRLRQTSTPANTLKANKNAAKAFRAYLQQNGLDIHFEKQDAPVLAEQLAQ